MRRLLAASSSGRDGCGNVRRRASSLQQRSRTTADFRVGVGHDTHRLAEGGPLVLGGVQVPHDRHAVGHSDADALLHAVTDALLGAAALGDIGELFPDSDPANRGRDSSEMLREAHHRVNRAGWRIVNLDCVVHAQRPRLAPFKEAIRQQIADVLRIAVERIGLKAKTGEQVGVVGREEAVQAECVVLLERTAPPPL